MGEPLDELRDILFGKPTAGRGRPERPDRPRRAPRPEQVEPKGKAVKRPPQCSSWDTFHDKPVRCQARAGHDKRHFTYVLDEVTDEYERHSW